MRATTSLTIKGFNKLSKKFAISMQKIKQQKYEQGIKDGTRKRSPGGGRKGELYSIELKLLFILTYFKCYPTMDIMGLLFDLDRSNVKQNIDNLTPVIEKTLGRTLSLPKRRISTLQEFFETFPETKDLFSDGTERPIQRHKNYKKQKDNYSGKKKTHTKKNIVISDENNKIGYLGPTTNGKEHDYSMFKNELDPKVIPKNIALWVDMGFTGIKKDYTGASIVIPKRKPKGKELSDLEKADNKIISGIRILSEHAIGGIKRLRIVTDKFRNKTDRFNDKAMFIACGLWNYQLEYC